MSTDQTPTEAPLDGEGGGGGHGGGDSRWLVTYADLLTLLMVLFLVLWVISSIDLAKFEKFKSGLGDFGNPAAEATAGLGAGTGTEPCERATETTEAPAEDGHASDTSHASDSTATSEDGHSTDTEAPADTETPTDTEAPTDTETPTDTEAPADEAGAEGAAGAPTGARVVQAAVVSGGGSETEEPATTEAPLDPCLGEGEAGTPGPGGGAPTTGAGGGALGAGDLPGVAEQIEDAVDAAGLPDVVSVSVEERGLVIMVTTDNVLFGSGAADITGEGASMIGVIAPTLNEFTNMIVVEGHTDKRPLRREGYDNWDLSVDRAVSVVKLLRSLYGVDSDRLSARGYGETRPVAEGDDEASYARNRRVEIVVLAQSQAEVDAATGGETTTTEPPATATTDAPASSDTQPVTTEAHAEGEH